MANQSKVYGAWLYQGAYTDGQDVPGYGWRLIGVRPGKFAAAPEGMKPKRGQVLLLMQGESATVITPEVT